MKQKHVNTGPSLFLNRLLREVKKQCFEKEFKIFNPNEKSIDQIDSYRNIKVGRFDGAYFYDFTLNNTKNFLKLRGKNKLANYAFNGRSFNKIFNSHLNRFSKKLQTKVDIIVYQSELSKIMQDKYVKKTNKPFTIINNGVPLDIFSPKKKRLKKKINLVITSHFRPHKRLYDAILLVNLINKKGVDARLKIIGNLDIVTLDFIKKYDLSNCDFIGDLASEKLPEIYNECHIGLSPSIFDPCPNSVAEMMACGLPVITCLESGASELLGIPSLCIKENLNLNFLEFQTIEKLPRINLDLWSNKVFEILDDFKYYQNEIIEQVETRLDIRIIAKKYIDFIDKY